VYEIIFYKNKQGKEPLTEYLDELRAKAPTNKDCRIKKDKIEEYLEILEQQGTRLGLPYTKHIEEDIWELRPLRDRIFFFYFKDDCFVMLHHFQKKTQKTPRKEIEQAKRNLKDFIERSK